MSLGKSPSKNGTPPDASLLSSLRFLLLPGVDMTNARIKILSAAITKKGGTIAPVLDKTVTHVIIPNGYKDYDKWPVLKSKYLDRIHLHTPEWITETLRRGEKLDENTYKLEYGQVTSTPVKQQQQQHQQEPESQSLNDDNSIKESPNTPTSNDSIQKNLRVKKRKRSVHSDSYEVDYTFSQAQDEEEITPPRAQRSLFDTTKEDSQTQPLSYTQSLTQSLSQSTSPSNSPILSYSQSQTQRFLSPPSSQFDSSDNVLVVPDAYVEIEHPTSRYLPQIPRPLFSSPLTPYQIETQNETEMMKYWSDNEEEREEGKEREAIKAERADTEPYSPVPLLDTGSNTYSPDETSSGFKPTHSPSLDFQLPSEYLPHLNPKPIPTSSYHNRMKPHLACQQSNAVINHNKHLTDTLERLEEMNESLGDKWRKYAYRKAVGILKKFPKKIENESDLTEIGAIKGMGGKMVAKLREILNTGRLEKLNHMENDKRIKTLELFSKIHGVGGTIAQKWYSLGLRTLEDVITSNKIQLSHMQQIGIKFFKDKQIRIPRSEVKTITDYVYTVATSILPGITVICCGSYRRGKPSSGDVDLLVTHGSFTLTEEGNTLRKNFMFKLMDILDNEVTSPYPWSEKKEAEEESDYSNSQGLWSIKKEDDKEKCLEKIDNERLKEIRKLSSKDYEKEFDKEWNKSDYKKVKVNIKEEEKEQVAKQEINNPMTAIKKEEEQKRKDDEIFDIKQEQFLTSKLSAIIKQELSNTHSLMTTKDEDNERKVKQELLNTNSLMTTKEEDNERKVKQELSNTNPLMTIKEEDNEINKCISSSSSSPVKTAKYPPFITGHLSTFSRLSSHHAQATFMGFCCLPSGHPDSSGINRRLDVKCYPVTMFPFALLYFTGSDHFNRSMRLYAQKLGWSLSDHGLAPAVRVNGDKVATGLSIFCRSEKDVFDAMGLNYVPPQQRNTGALEDK